MNIQASIESQAKLKAIIDKYLGKNIKVIFEFGARYCEDTIEFENAYSQARVFTFECNPKTIEACREKVKGKDRITLIESAVGDYDGKIMFYPMNEEKTTTTWQDGNQGASSLFKASGKYKVENYVQDEIEVSICKLSTVMKQYAIDKVDIMWMDIQGAELLALKGLDDRLKDVKVIHTEVEFMEIYKGQPLFGEIKEFLFRNGFLFYGFSNRGEYAGDAIFINESVVNSSIRNRMIWWFDSNFNKSILR